MAGGVLSTLLTTDITEAGWYDDDYAYRQKVTIDNSGSADSDKKVLIDFDTDQLVTDEKISSDFSDLRVTDNNGKVLPHYIDASEAASAGDVETVGTRSTSGAVNIDDAGNPAEMYGAGRQIVSTSTGDLYAVIYDATYCEILEIK